jgi:dihydrodipicolinate synthase/N-acetylneuraminate lyase
VELREGLAGMPFQAALKAVLEHRGIIVHADVRAPLRGLTPDERAIALAL